MPQFTIATNIDYASKNSTEWVSKSQFKSKNSEVEVNGIKYKVINKEEKRFSSLKRIIFVVLAILSCGLLLIPKQIRKICFKGKQSVHFAVPALLMENHSAPSLNGQTLNSQPQEHTLEKQIALAKQSDQIAAPNSWRRGIGAGEEEQSLEAFKIYPDTIANAHRKRLKIYFIGEASSNEMRMMKIISDYLQATQGIESSLASAPLALDPSSSRTRGHLQYAAEPQLGTLQQLNDDESFSLGFTNQDIFPSSHADSMNFIYGVGLSDIACGLFSTNRLTKPDFNQTLVRLMKLASHEFAHMRGVLHCIPYSCTMQGANCADEADQSPMTFCAQDMAKLCYLNTWSLKEGYQRQLHFFEHFFQTYNLKIDFSHEISHLKYKIAKL